MDKILRRVKAKYREVRRTPTRILISVFKAALAYMILVIMAMSTKVRSGFSYPIVLTSATVVVVAGSPGANIGQCIGASTFGLVGVGLGAVAFVILAKLAHAPVAQGIVFVIIVYLFSLLKAKSMKFFGTALLGILVSFAGIYTSLLLPGKPFSPAYLEDYLKSYTLGGAIVLTVNLLILPISSEKELRRTLVTSLGHIRTFAHLLAKSYAITITEEERDVRDGLSQSIRADFGILQQKLGGTTLEINYSKFSMDDYRRMIDWTNRLQQDLIGTYSTVLASETAWRDPDQQLFRKEFLPSTQASFLVLRKEMSHAIREICRVLGDGISVEELLEYEEYRGSDTPERKAEDGHGNGSFDGRDQQHQQGHASHKHEDLVKRLMDGGMRRRLDAEIGVAPTPANGRSPAVSRRQSMHELERPKQGNTLQPTGASKPSSGQATPRASELDETTNVASSSGAPSTAFPSMSATATRVTSRSVSPLVMGHYRFRDSQQEVLAHLLCSGEMHAADASLRLDAKQPAMTERFTAQAEREAKRDVELKNRKKGRIPPNPRDDEMMKEREKKKELDACDPESSQGRLLLAVTSFMFLMGQFTRDLDGLHKFVCGEISVRKKKRLHIHVFETPKRAASASEALSGASTPSYMSGPSGPSPSNLKPETPNGRAASTTTATTSADAEQKVNKDKQKKPHRKYHIPMNEALAILEGRTPVYPKKKTVFQRFIEMESVLRSDASIIALKTAAAAIAYTAIILAPSSRSFFIQYALTGGVLSVVVAMSPSLGQTLFTFKNQIIGTVVGNIYGMVLLYIFRDVGGYKYNPYGIVCMLIPFALVMSYLIYTKPPYLPLGLLALNGANLTIFTLVIYENTPTFTDSPALRAGKALTAMCIGLSIAFAFQFMILRSPARRLLRQAVADLMSSMTAYYILHAAFISALNPDAESMTGERAPLSILNEVSHDLARRERGIQGQLIAIYPLLNFAKLEPDFGSAGFRGDVYKRIITSSQLFMDRLREARVIITTLNDDNVDVDAHQDPSVFFSIPSFAPIASYRRLHNRLNKHRLYMLTTALQSKTPLPQDSLSTRFVPTGIVQHDILVLTQRLTKEPGGHEIIRSSAFLRLLSYMLAVGQWRYHVNAIEEAVGDLLGVWEDDEFL